MVNTVGWIHGGRQGLHVWRLHVPPVQWVSSGAVIFNPLVLASSRKLFFVCHLSLKMTKMIEDALD